MVTVVRSELLGNEPGSVNISLLLEWDITSVSGEKGKTLDKGYLVKGNKDILATAVRSEKLLDKNREHLAVALDGHSI